MPCGYSRVTAKAPEHAEGTRGTPRQRTRLATVHPPLHYLCVLVRNTIVHALLCRLTLCLLYWFQNLRWLDRC